MRTKAKRKPSFKAGMYLLENLTSGMYTDPMTILREYIQNGVDSIDLTDRKNPDDLLEIRIELDPGERCITIRDNGHGIPSALAEEILSSIGSSNKTEANLRGFRGIGRLGGIAFSDKAVFRTKAEGENVESIQEWDCHNLRRLLLEYKKKSLSFNQLFRRITSFSQENCKKSAESYFEVTLHRVSSFRNYIFDITRARRYLSQVAPVPFHPDKFSFGEEIDKYLEQNLKHYRKYNVILNGEQIYRPYRDAVRITKGGFDSIASVNRFELKNDKGVMIACGWHGEREELLGSIIRGDDSAGIRVRVGNIMIGDNHLLDGCFREPRFNGYVPGEIHVEYDDLMPNSRRDDFVDNKSKGIFYNAIEREIGLPISKEIRLRSRLKSEARANAAVAEKKVEPKPQKDEPAKVKQKTDEQKKLTETSENPSSSRILEEILRTCQKCPKFAKILGEAQRK